MPLVSDPMRVSGGGGGSTSDSETNATTALDAAPCSGPSGAWASAVSGSSKNNAGRGDKAADERGLGMNCSGNARGRLLEALAHALLKLGHVLHPWLPTQNLLNRRLDALVVFRNGAPWKCMSRATTPPPSCAPPGGLGVASIPEGKVWLAELTWRGRVTTPGGHDAGTVFRTSV